MYYYEDGTCSFSLVEKKSNSKKEKPEIIYRIIKDKTVYLNANAGDKIDLIYRMVITKYCFINFIKKAEILLSEVNLKGKKYYLLDN